MINFTENTLSRLNELPKQDLTQNQEEYVSALESGEFEQTVATLCHEGCYCVLGVKAELDYRKGLIGKESCNGRATYYTLNGTNSSNPRNRSSTRLLKPSIKTGGFDSHYGDGAFLFSVWVEQVEGPSMGFNSLTTMNDTGDFTFEQMAWLMRTYPVLVFKQQQ